MYNALIARVKTRPLPNADRLLIGTIVNQNDIPISTVVVGIDTVDNELGIFFPCDGQLSDDMCKENNLIGYVDQNGVHQGGYFDHKKRVRAQTFRGIKSDGYFSPLSSVLWTGVKLSDLTEGLQFCELNGKEVCRKYFNPATDNVRNTAQKSNTRKAVITFPKHMETEQLDFYVSNIPIGSVCSISEKEHGTSTRFGNVYAPVELNKWKKFINRFYPLFPTHEFQYMIGTRNVVLTPQTKNSWYGNEQFRYNAVQNIQLHEGEVLYAELTGFTTEGKEIMNNQNTKELKDKKVQKQYGDLMHYTYGNMPNQCSMHIYRIILTHKDGSYVEYSNEQMKKRCKELGLYTVHQLSDTFIYDGDSQSLLDKVNNLLEGCSIFDEKHIREGIVLRIEDETGTLFLKKKSYTFKILEGIAKEDDTIIDMEETA